MGEKSLEPTEDEASRRAAGNLGQMPPGGGTRCGPVRLPFRQEVQQTPDGRRQNRGREAPEGKGCSSPRRPQGVGRSPAQRPPHPHVPPGEGATVC